MLIFSGLWIYEASKPIYEDRDEVISSYTHHGVCTYSVPVTKENSLYPVGTTLKMGMPAYFFVISPTINMSFTYSLDATDSANVSGNLETTIVATGKEGSVTEGGGTEGTGTENSSTREKIFWQKEFPLKSDDNVNTWKGVLVTKNYTINVSEIQSKVKAVQKELNYSQDANIEIVNRINYIGKINGEKVQGTKDFAIPLEIGFSYYQLPEKLDFSQEINTTKKVSYRSNPPLSMIGFPLSIFLLSFILIGTTLVFLKMRKVGPEYIEKLEKDIRSSHFKEFISRGKLPEERDSLIKIEVFSLKELIDAAADMNSRVIYDAKAETYFMIHGSVIYFFLENIIGRE